MLPDELVATVDGAPVALVVDEAHSLTMLTTQGWEILTLRLDPEPVPGQMVSIRGGVCVGNCGQLELDYVATDLDLEIAAPTGTVEFDVARLNQSPFSFCGATGSFVPARVDVDATAFADEELALLEVVARNASAGLERHFGMALARDGHVSPWVIFDESALGDAFPVEGWCVDVQVVDPAGNLATIASSCDACRVALAVGDEAPDQLDYETVPGGPCDEALASSSSSAESSSSGPDAGSGTGGQDEGGELTSSDDAPSADDPTVDGGCGCKANGVTTSWWLLALSLVRRRRST
ncbi:MAG: hypothetical protein IAG13_16640 [Deltaproteobacteria bacterium]|nr:hypothetical protein [Nannocystaceae bacterium]